MNYLLDTCVISELIKERPSTRVVEWVRGINENFMFLSVLTIGEIHKGIRKLPVSKNRNTLREWVSKDLCQRFENRILSVSMEIAGIWGEIQGNAEKKGEKIPVVDSLIAATAIAHALTVVTGNAVDMEKTGVPIYNPWEPT